MRLLLHGLLLLLAPRRPRRQQLLPRRLPRRLGVPRGIVRLHPRQLLLLLLLLAGLLLAAAAEAFDRRLQLHLLGRLPQVLQQPSQRPSQQQQPPKSLTAAVLL